MWLELLNLNVLPWFCHRRQLHGGLTEQRNFFKIDEMTRAGGDCFRKMSVIYGKYQKINCGTEHRPAPRSDLFEPRCPMRGAEDEFAL